MLFEPHGTSVLHKNGVVGKVMGSSPMGCMSYLPIKQNQEEPEQDGCILQCLHKSENTTRNYVPIVFFFWVSYKCNSGLSKKRYKV